MPHDSRDQTNTGGAELDAQRVYDGSAPPDISDAKETDARGMQYRGIQRTALLDASRRRRNLPSRRRSCGATVVN